MATADYGSGLVLIQHHDADVRDTLIACMSEAGLAPVAVARLEALTALVHAHVIARPGLLLLDIQRGYAADLEPIGRVLALPLLHNVRTLLLTTAGTRAVTALPSLGPLVRYVGLPFELDDLLALVAVPPAKQPKRLPPRRSGDVLIAQALPARC